MRNDVNTGKRGGIEGSPPMVRRLAQRYLSPGMLNGPQAQRMYDRLTRVSKRSGMISRLLSRKRTLDGSSGEPTGVLTFAVPRHRTFSGGDGESMALAPGFYAHAAHDMPSIASGPPSPLSAGESDSSGRMPAPGDGTAGEPEVHAAPSQLQRKLSSRADAPGSVSTRQIRRLHEQGNIGTARKAPLIQRLESRMQEPGGTEERRGPVLAGPVGAAAVPTMHPLLRSESESKPELNAAGPSSPVSRNPGDVADPPSSATPPQRTYSGMDGFQSRDAHAPPVSMIIPERRAPPDLQKQVTGGRAIIGAEPPRSDAAARPQTAGVLRLSRKRSSLVVRTAGETPAPSETAQQARSLAGIDGSSIIRDHSDRADHRAAEPGTSPLQYDGAGPILQRTNQDGVPAQKAAVGKTISPAAAGPSAGPAMIYRKHMDPDDGPGAKQERGGDQAGVDASSPGADPDGASDLSRRPGAGEAALESVALLRPRKPASGDLQRTYSAEVAAPAQLILRQPKSGNPDGPGDQAKAGKTSAPASEERFMRAGSPELHTDAGADEMPGSATGPAFGARPLSSTASGTRILTAPGPAARGDIGFPAEATAGIIHRHAERDRGRTVYDPPVVPAIGAPRTTPQAMPHLQRKPAAGEPYGAEYGVRAGAARSATMTAVGKESTVEHPTLIWRSPDRRSTGGQGQIIFRSAGAAGESRHGIAAEGGAGTDGLAASTARDSERGNRKDVIDLASLADQVSRLISRRIRIDGERWGVGR